MKQSGRLVISAYSVHRGGGLTLLRALLDNLPPDRCVILWLDERYPYPEPSTNGDLSIRRVRPSFLGRLRAEWQIASTLREADRLLCFGNLPPLFTSKCKQVSVFLQNRLLLSEYPLNEFPMFTRIRIQIERAWLRARYGLVSQFLVQSSTMRQAVWSHLGKGVAVEITPFLGPPSEQAIAANKPQDFDFVYVASGEPHKNHRVLIEGWKLLAEEGIRPTLALTLDERDSPALCAWIHAEAQEYDLRVLVTGPMDKNQIQNLYERSGALIYPSLIESYGLPLLEATSAGLPVVASELDYVRDVIVPSHTFDPRSPVSLRRAVLRQIGAPEAPRPPFPPAALVSKILSA